MVALMSITHKESAVFTLIQTLSHWNTNGSWSACIIIMPFNDCAKGIKNEVQARGSGFSMSTALESRARENSRSYDGKEQIHIQGKNIGKTSDFTTMTGSKSAHSTSKGPKIVSQII